MHRLYGETMARQAEQLAGQLEQQRMDCYARLEEAAPAKKKTSKKKKKAKSAPKPGTRPPTGKRPAR